MSGYQLTPSTPGKSLLVFSSSGNKGYWFPVLPLAQQTGMTNSGTSFAS